MRLIVSVRKDYPPNKLNIPLMTFSPSFTNGLSKIKLSMPERGCFVVVVRGTSVNSGRNVSFVVAVVVVVLVVEVDFLFDFPKKKAIVDFLVVVVLRDDMMEVGNLRSLVLDVVDGVGRSRVVASSSLARLPSCSRGCWVVVSSFRKNIHEKS